MILQAPAKINLALVVGPVRANGKHELATVFERVDLADEVEVGPADTLQVTGFPEDTIVRAAVEALAAAAAVAPRFSVALTKKIPVASGLGGGSSDAAAVLLEINRRLPRPLPTPTLHAIASEVGADVAFFLADGPQLGTGDGSDLTPLQLPRDYSVVLWHPTGEHKAATREVYRRFDEREGATGFEERRQALLEALTRVRRPRDLALLPPNDLAASPSCERLLALGAFRADVSGAGPVLYGLFDDLDAAGGAAATLAGSGWTRVCRPGGSEATVAA